MHALQCMLNLQSFYTSIMASDLEKQASVDGHAHRNYVDAALQLVQNNTSQCGPLDPEKNRRLLRRIDLHVMPMICIVYCKVSCSML